MIFIITINNIVIHTTIRIFILGKIVFSIYSLFIVIIIIIIINIFINRILFFFAAANTVTTIMICNRTLPCRVQWGWTKKTNALHGGLGD